MSIEHFPSPMIFAHRGASAYAPENTLPAFSLAISQQAGGIELDVKLSADGEVVVIHDQSVDRTTNSHGDIRTFTVNQLKELDAGSKFAIEFTGTKIPTLREVFESVGGKIFINIELTNYASPRDDLVEKVVNLVKQYDLGKMVLFSSFNPFNLRKAKLLYPQIPIGLLLIPTASIWFVNHVYIPLLSCEAIHPHYSSITRLVVDDVHRLGRRVHCWTVNTETELSRLQTAGVDGIFSDDPLLARNFFLPK